MSDQPRTVNITEQLNKLSKKHYEFIKEFEDLAKRLQDGYELQPEDLKDLAPVPAEPFYAFMEEVSQLFSILAPAEGGVQ